MNNSTLYKLVLASAAGHNEFLHLMTPRRKYAKPIQSEESIKLAKERAEAKRKRKAEKRLANR